MNLHLILVSLLSLLLSACGGISVSKMQTELANSAKTVSSIDEIIFTPILEEKAQPIDLGNKSPSFLFENGKNYFAAYSIENYNVPRYLQIKSYLSSIVLPSASILVPEVTILDKDKKVINTIKPTKLIEDMDSWKGPFFQGKIPLPVNTAFIIIHKTDTFPKDLVVRDMGGEPFKMPLAPAGSLEVMLSKPLPIDYDFSMATLNDSVKEYGTHKADFFYISKINGKDVSNSLIHTKTLNRGRGLSMRVYLIDRELPANQPVTLTIIGRTHYAAPILELTGEVFEIKGDVNLVPEKNATYVVKGTLGKTSSSVWVENEVTHEVIDKKIESNGDSELGVGKK